MSDFPAPQYSRKQVVKAGKALLQPMPVSGDTDERLEQYRSVFKVAYDWRSSHAYPMRQMRQDLRTMVSSLKGRAVTAARLKRMSSIRKKLERLNTTLAQIQDIGGCRAIVDTQHTLNGVLAQYRSQENRHHLREDRSYIDAPRLSGYRSHHLVFDFVPLSLEEEPFRGRRIEVQLRSRIQHSWATAVEAIGLNRGEDLKASEGDADWLRFFQLISAEFADFEGTSAVPYSLEKSARVAEIRALDQKLFAVRKLDTLNQAFRFLEKNTSLGAKYFLIRFDNAARTMEIEGFEKISRVSDRYGFEERHHEHVNSVVVEVDSVKALKEAYPNYFLNVRLFTQNVMNIIKDEPLETVLRVQQEKKTVFGHEVGWLEKYFPGVNKRRAAR